MTTILCVDDNADLVELLSELLKMMGYEVRTAPGGDECLRMINGERFHPDLILLDIMMEPMDGWETLGHIRENPVSRDIPVVMLTGKYPTMSEAETYGPMIDDYLMKPYHPTRSTNSSGVSWRVRDMYTRSSKMHGNAVSGRSYVASISAWRRRLRYGNGSVRSSAVLNILTMISCIRQKDASTKSKNNSSGPGCRHEQESFHFQRRNISYFTR